MYSHVVLCTVAQSFCVHLPLNLLVGYVHAIKYKYIRFRLIVSLFYPTLFDLVSSGFSGISQLYLFMAKILYRLCQFSAMKKKKEEEKKKEGKKEEKEFRLDSNDFGFIKFCAGVSKISVYKRNA